MKKGLFISFEGGEGSGKTTQINRLAERLTAEKYKVVTTREPGGTPEGEKIRNLIVQREGGDWSPQAEILLLYAARVMHLEKLIRPALAEEKIVITDRFSDSTMAYQGYGHGADLEQIRALDKIFLGSLKPDITFILDVDAKAGLERSNRRLSAEELSIHQTEDRFEQLNIAFHEKLRRGFLEIAKADPKRCRVIDAAQSVDEIAKIIAETSLGALS